MTNLMSELELSELERRALTDFLMTEQGETILKLIADLRAARVEAEQMRAKTLEDVLVALQNIKELYMTLEAGAKKDADWIAMETWGRCRKAVNVGMETVRALTTPDGQGEK